MINYKTIGDVNAKSQAFASYFAKFRDSLAADTWEPTGAPFVAAGKINADKSEFEAEWCGRNFLITLDRFPQYLNTENGGPALRMQTGKLSAFHLQVGKDGVFQREKLGTVTVNRQGYATVADDGADQGYSLESEAVPLFFRLIEMPMSENEIF